MTVTTKAGKVVLRIRSKHWSMTIQHQLSAVEAAKLAIRIHAASEKAAKRAKAFSKT